MRYLAGWLLLAIGGNASPTSDQIKELFDTVGVGYDEERAEQVVAELKGKDVDDLIATGRAKLATVSLGGVGATGPAVGGGGSGGGPAPAAKEEEEEKKSEKEESDDDMGFGLFD